MNHSLSDPHEKDYEMKSVDASDCDDPGCDKMADCGCNLLSGNYKCACRRGYHGTGEKRVPGSSCYGKYPFIHNHKQKSVNTYLFGYLRLNITHRDYKYNYSYLFG